jgi:hypothetical protein
MRSDLPEMVSLPVKIFVLVKAVSIKYPPVLIYLSPNPSPQEGGAYSILLFFGSPSLPGEWAGG